jgi:DNA polymerase III epsilon subunit family exonuclease
MKSSEYIFIDLETTGLSDKADKIIEIGAFRVNAKLEIIDTYHSLVNPGISVPYQISILTHGLDDEMLKDAPSILLVKDDFLSFIGDAPLVAHNAGFEEGFLKANFPHSIKNKFMDTMELMALFFPAIGSLKLDNIIKFTAVREDGERHRALEDARDMLNVMLFVKDNISKDIRYYLTAQRIISSFDEREWPWVKLIKNITPATPPAYIKPVVVDDNFNVLQANKELKFSHAKVDPEALCALIKDPLDVRPEQHDYIRKVAKAFNDDESLMIEAGTGTGKTIAYLLPALDWAIKNDACVLVSTKTKILQQQIFTNDIPLAKELLKLSELKAVKVQGRNNYLCVRKMDRFFADMDLIDSFESRYSKLFFFAFDKLSNGGDFTLIPSWIKTSFPHVSKMLDVLCADVSSCYQSRCDYYNDCHYFSMARSARGARLMVTNHALMMNWPVHIPRGDKIIFDEAHNLQREATEAVTLELGTWTLGNLLFVLSDDQKGRGVVPALKKMGVDAELAFQLEGWLLKLKDYDYQLKEIYQSVFEKTLSAVNKKLNPDYPENLVLYSPTMPYGQYNVAKVEPWQELALSFSGLRIALEKLGEYLSSIKVSVTDKEYSMILESLIERVNTLSSLLADVLRVNNPDNTDPHHVLWLSWDQKNLNWLVSKTLIDVGEILAKDVYPRYTSAIFTSATMSSGTKSISEEIGFDRIGDRVASTELISIASPFDYKSNSLMLFMRDSSDVWQKHFVEDLSHSISNTVELLNGRTLVLFSSLKRLYQAYEHLVQTLAPKGFKILRYNLGSDVINYFMTEPKAVLLGSESFGEGLDIRGEKLSCVILERMPVNMRTPIYISREDLYKSKNRGSHYTGFDIPQRIMKLRQWSGRLIRSKTDKGLVIVYDKWFSTQPDNIKQMIVNSVSPMPVAMVSKKDLSSTIRAKYSDWGYEI